MTTHGPRTYYSKHDGRPHLMTSRTGDLCILEDEAGATLTLTDAELDEHFSTEPPSPSHSDAGVLASQESSVVSLSDRGGANLMDVKARRGLVPGVQADGSRVAVGGILSMTGACSICGKTECSHLLGEPLELRVKKVQRKGTGAWVVVFHDGSWVEVWWDGGEGEPSVTPYGRRKGGVVSEQAILRAKAAVRICSEGGGGWFEGGEKEMRLVGAPADKGVCVKRDDGEVGVDAYPDEDEGPYVEPPIACGTFDEGVRREALGIPASLLAGSAAESTARVLADLEARRAPFGGGGDFRGRDPRTAAGNEGSRVANREVPACPRGCAGGPFPVEAHDDGWQCTACGALFSVKLGGEGLHVREPCGACQGTGSHCGTCGGSGDECNEHGTCDEYLEVDCEECGGRAYFKRYWRACSRCQGKGAERFVRREEQGLTEVCRVCQGSGREFVAYNEPYHFESFEVPPMGGFPDPRPPMGCPRGCGGLVERRPTWDRCEGCGVEFKETKEGGRNLIVFNEPWEQGADGSWKPVKEKNVDTTNVKGDDDGLEGTGPDPVRGDAERGDAEEEAASALSEGREATEGLGDMDGPEDDGEVADFPPSGRLRKLCLVEGVTDHEDGWIVGFGDGSMALVAYEDPEQETGLLQECGWPRGTVLAEPQGPLALDAVRHHMMGKAFVQLVLVSGSVDCSQEWSVLFPNGLRVRVSRPSDRLQETGGRFSGLYVSMDDIEECSAVEDDEEEFMRWRDRALAAVGEWLVKHDSFDSGVDAADDMSWEVEPPKWANWPCFNLDVVVPDDTELVMDGKTMEDEDDYALRFEDGQWRLYLEPLVARDSIKAMLQLMADEVIWEREPWIYCKLPPELNVALGNRDVVVSDQGVVMFEGVTREYVLRREEGCWLLGLAPDFVADKGGRTIVLARNAQKLHELVVPILKKKATPEQIKVIARTLDDYEAEHGPQVRAVHMLDGGVGKGWYWQDWRIEFHKGQVVEVTEQIRGAGAVLGDLHDKTFCTGEVELAYQEPALRCVKSETEWITKNVKVERRGAEFEVRCSFGKTARLYAWRWEGGEWGCLTEHDPKDTSGWREKSLLLLKRWLRHDYPIVPKSELRVGMALDVLTEEGPVGVNVTPEKDGSLRRLAFRMGSLKRWPKDDQPMMRRRVEDAVKRHLDQPIDPVNEAELKGQIVEMTAELAARKAQIEAGEQGEGHYPVHKAAARPDEDAERFQRFGCATEDGMFFVLVQWTTVGDLSRPVAYDVEGEPHSALRKKIIASVKHHIEMGRRCPHDGAKCHHNCEPDECFREEAGMELSEPWEGYPLPGHGPDAAKHTEHCQKRQKYGDGECECAAGALLDKAYDPEAKPVDVGYMNIEKKKDVLPEPATLCFTTTFTDENKTRPTLKGLESRIDNLELGLNELMEGDDTMIVLATVHERLLKLEQSIEPVREWLGSLERGISRDKVVQAAKRLEMVATLADQIKQAAKGVAAHEQWLQGLERRFAIAAMPDHSKGASALLKTMMATIDDLVSKTDAQKDLGSALSKKVGEMTHRVDDTYSASLRLDRMMTDYTWQLAKIIEIVIGPNDQLAKVVKMGCNVNLVKKVNKLFSWTNSMSQGISRIDAIVHHMAAELAKLIYPVPYMWAFDAAGRMVPVDDKEKEAAGAQGYQGGDPEVDKLLFKDPATLENATVIKDYQPLGRREGYRNANGDSFPDPVPCGVAVILTKKIAGATFVCFGKRKGAHGEGEYSLPGGRMEPGEDPETTAIREVKEETGIELRSVKEYELHPYNASMAGGQPWVTLFFTAEVDQDTDPEVMEPDKSELWDFFNVANLPEPLFGPCVPLAHAAGWTIRSEEDHCSDE